MNKKPRTLLLLPLMLLSTLAIFAPVTTVFGAASLSISPAVINDSTHGVGTQFQYTVSASGIGGTAGTLFAYQFQLTYDPTVLQANSVDSFGPFFDTLASSGNALPVTSIDNTNGMVSVAVSSLGPSTSAATTTEVLGVITFNVTGLGRSDQALVNSILIHNAGGGNLVNIPVTTSGAVFSNQGLVGIATWPYAFPAKQWAYPEAVKYSYSADNSFTPGCLDLFANINSTGTLPVNVVVQFTVSSAFGTVVVSTPVQQIAQNTLYPVPLHTCFAPVSTSGVLQVGNYHVKAQIFYQQVNLDGTLGPVVKGPLHTFVTKVAP